jgi:hypothetical protein
MATKLTPDAQKVSDFLVKIVKDILNEQGIRMGISDFGVLSAGKKVTPQEYIPVLRAAFSRLMAEHPEVVEIMLEGASEAIKTRIRKACMPDDAS